MSGFRSFGSFDEMIEFMARSEEAANASLTDEQKALTWGSYWFKPYEGIVIFGYVFTEQEFIDRERHSYHHGAPLDPHEEQEFEHTLHGVRANHERGYLFGEAWSVWEPAGELGDTHRAGAWPITKEQFETARANGWDHTTLAVRDWLEPLWRSVIERGSHGPAH